MKVSTDDPNIDPANDRLLNKFDVQRVPEPSNVGGLSVVVLGGMWLLKKNLLPGSSINLLKK
ncbi:MAG: PEP-CTERM sorting domain-containing protein [Nostoc sp.]